LSRRGRTGSDFLIFALFAAFPNAYFLLSSYGTDRFQTVAAYSLILAFGIVAIYAVGKSGSRATEPVWDRNMDRFGLLISFGLGAVAFFFGGILFGFKPYQSSILVLNIGATTLQTASATATDLSIASIISNVLWQGSMVSPAEELMKVAGLYSLYSRWRNEAMAVMVTIGLWAGLHTLLVGFTWWMIFVAWVVGLLFYIPMRVTGSILASFFSHWMYNSLTIVIPLILAALG